MVAYLANGWFTEVGLRRLRAEVIDGAIDAAASLHQAQIPAEAIDKVALQIRSMAHLLNRAVLSGGPTAFGCKERHVLRHHLTEATDAHVALQALVLDLLDHVDERAAVGALCLHLMHVAHLTRLLQLAHRHGLKQALPAALAAAPASALPPPEKQPTAAWHAPR